MAEDTSTPITIPPTIKKYKVAIGISAVIIIILGLLSTFFGYQYKKEVKINVAVSTENDTLKKQLSTHTSSTTETVPVEVGGKIVYRTIVKYIHDSQENVDATHNAAVSTYVKTVTVTKKDFATFGLGKNLYMDWCVLAQKDVISTPFGSFGIVLVPDLNYIKRSSGLITWKP